VYSCLSQIYKSLSCVNANSLAVVCLFSLPKVALDVLDGMLALDPSRRLSAKAVLDSPWLKDVNPDLIPPPE
jgi:serine/threonine protein kinase